MNIQSLINQEMKKTKSAMEAGSGHFRTGKAKAGRLGVQGQPSYRVRSWLRVVRGWLHSEWGGKIAAEVAQRWLQS